MGFELGRLLFFACCASLDPALTTRADRWLCLDISAPLNTLDYARVKGFEVACRPLQRLNFRRCARTTSNSQRPRPRSLPTPPPCAYPQTAGFSAHDSPAPHRAGLRVRDDLRLWPRGWALFCPTPRAAHGGVSEARKVSPLPRGARTCAARSLMARLRRLRRGSGRRHATVSRAVVRACPSRCGSDQGRS